MANEQNERSALGTALAVGGFAFRTFIWDTNDSLGANLLKVGLTGASVLAAPFSGGTSLAARGALSGAMLATKIPAVSNALFKSAGAMEAVAPSVAKGFSYLFKSPVINKQTGLAVEGATKISLGKSAATVGSAAYLTENFDAAGESGVVAGKFLLDKGVKNAGDLNRGLGDPASGVIAQIDQLTGKKAEAPGEENAPRAEYVTRASADGQNPGAETGEAGAPFDSMLSGMNAGDKKMASGMLNFLKNSAKDNIFASLAAGTTLAFGEGSIMSRMFKAALVFVMAKLVTPLLAPFGNMIMNKAQDLNLQQAQQDIIKGQQPGGPAAPGTAPAQPATAVPEQETSAAPQPEAAQPAVADMNGHFKASAPMPAANDPVSGSNAQQTFAKAARGDDAALTTLKPEQVPPASNNRFYLRTSDMSFNG